RERRQLSQKALGKAVGVKQEWISKLEDPNYGRLTISTLLKVASAFDCGLIVDFVPYSRILNSSTHLTPASFDVPSYSEDLALEKEPEIVAMIPVRNTAPPPEPLSGASDELLSPIGMQIEEKSDSTITTEPEPANVNALIAA